MIEKNSISTSTCEETSLLTRRFSSSTSRTTTAKASNSALKAFWLRPRCIRFSSVPSGPCTPVKPKTS